MKYINILLIILIIGIISYMILNNRIENFSESDLVDESFNILDIKNELHNLKCIENKCDIKFIDINYYNNNKSIYYITNNNDIYILQTTGGLSKSRINILQEIDITAICYTNDYNYGFIGVKSKISGNISIYYTNDKSNNWLKLDFNENYYTTNTIIEKYSEYCEISKDNIDKMNPKNLIIDNIIIETTLSEGKEVPSKIIFTTFGKDNLFRFDEKIYRSETTIQYINLSNEINNFDNNIESQYIFESNLLKYYLFENSNENFVKQRKINKIINDKNNNNFIVLIKNYTELQFENYELIGFNTNGFEFYYILSEVLSTFIMDIKYYKNVLNNKSFLIGLLNDKKNIITIDLNNTDTLTNNSLLNSYSLQPRNSINTDHSINEIYKHDSDETIKLFDLDYNYELFNEADKANYYDLYLITTNNEINIITLNNFLNIHNGNYLSDGKWENSTSNEIKKLEYPKEYIENINYIGIHNKKKSSHEYSIIISNEKTILIYKELNKWNKIKIDNLDIEYSKINKANFISNINDSNKLIFKGDNSSDRKIYKINFEEDKYVDILIVGGGGGGGYGGGGGGAGDAKYYNNIKFSKGTYDITVGSGGNSGIIESDSNGKQGFNSSIEKPGDSKFDRIIVAGGGGGGGFNSINTNTPINGIIGHINFSSGGGGGAGKQNAIGGYGNDVSGSGGSSLFVNTFLYGGGGGGSGFKLENKTNEVDELYNGLTPTNTNIGNGGIGTKIEKKFEYYDNIIVSIGGNGGYYGELNTENNYSPHNKYDNYINKNMNIAGKGGDGSIIITNETSLNSEISKKFKNILTKGNPGLIVFVTSKNELDDTNDTTFVGITGDDIVNNYSLQDRDLKDEYNKELALTKMTFKDRIKQNKLEKEKIIKERIEFKKNIYELEIREAKLMNANNSNYSSTFLNTIANPTGNAFLPYHSNVHKFDNERIATDNELDYKIIKIFKDLLYRQPTYRELNDYKIRITNNNIKIIDIKNIIINGEEYRNVIALQSNETNKYIPYQNSTNYTYQMLREKYTSELGEVMPDNLLNPIKDIYYDILDADEYKLRALYINSNFDNFKDDIKTNKDINRKNIKLIFNKYFSIGQLRDKANDINKYDSFHRLKSSEFQSKDKYDDFRLTKNEYNDNYNDNNELNFELIHDFHKDIYDDAFINDGAFSNDDAFNNTISPIDDSLISDFDNYKRIRDAFDSQYN